MTRKASLPTVGDVIRALQKFPDGAPIRVHDGDRTLNGVDRVVVIADRVCLLPPQRPIRRRPLRVITRT